MLGFLASARYSVGGKEHIHIYYLVYVECALLTVRGVWYMLVTLREHAVPWIARFPWDTFVAK